MITREEAWEIINNGPLNNENIQKLRNYIRFGNFELETKIKRYFQLYNIKYYSQQDTMTKEEYNEFMDLYKYFQEMIGEW